MLLGAVACTDAQLEQEHCGSAKCDDVNQTSLGKLMPRAPSTPGNVSITRNQDEWFFEITGAKGEIVLLSESYAQRTSALNGMLSVEENGVLAERYDVVEVDGGWGFVLKAANHEVIADSRVFASESEAEQGAAEARELVAGIVQYKAALRSGAGFELEREGSDWTFDLKDDEGEPLLLSQTYSRRADALTGIASVRNNGKEAARYVLLDSPHRFIVKAGNGQEIAESAKTFASAAEARAAADSVQALLVSEKVANPW